MDLDDLFDVDDTRPKVKIKGTEPRHVHIDLAVGPEPTSARIVEALDTDPGDCPYGSSDEPEPELEPEPEPLDGDLDVDIATRARAAAQAHDAYAEAKSTYNDERSRLQKKMDEELLKLRLAMTSAGEAEAEALKALEIAMEKDGITTIPMTDRPDIKTKVSKGSKKGITRNWLVDPENIAVKAYDEALAGEPTIMSGKDFAGKLWDAQPKSEGNKTIIIPDAYEDEPDHN